MLRALASNRGADDALTPSPHRRSLPGLNSEQTDTLAAYRLRGLYPYPGLADSARRRSAAVDGALTASYYRHHGRIWRALWGEGLSDVAIARARRVSSQLRRLSLPRIGAECIDRGDQFGFAFAERIMALDDSGEWSLVDLVWVESWQLFQWVERRGFPVGVRLSGAEGITDPIDLGRFLLTSRRGTSRTPEGHGALRPLWWPLEDIRRMLVKAAKARDRAGTPKRRYRVPHQSLGDDSLNAAIRAEEAALTGDETFAIESDLVTVVEDEGPRLNPDYLAAIRAHTHDVKSQLGDPLTEEGMATQGARAAVVEQSRSADQVERGKCAAYAEMLTRELIWPVYEANGWPLDEAPYIHSGGGPDTNGWRAARELLALDGERIAQGLPALFTPEDWQKVRGRFMLDFGFGQDDQHV